MLSPTVHDLIAILQHETYEEIGQLTDFLSHSESQSDTDEAVLNNRVFTGSSSEDKQPLEINARPPTRPEGHKRTTLSY